MSVYYVDTSAALKLLIKESHSRAFAQFYDAHAQASCIGSALLKVEAAGAVVARGFATRSRCRELAAGLVVISPRTESDGKS